MRRWCLLVSTFSDIPNILRLQHTHRKAFQLFSFTARFRRRRGRRPYMAFVFSMLEQSNIQTAVNCTLQE